MKVRNKQKAESRKLPAISCQLITVVFVLLAVHAESQVVLSLDSVLAMVDRRNPMLQEYDSKVDALNAYAEGSKSWMAPMVGFGPYWYPYPGQTVMSEAEKGMFMASIEQDIPNPGKLKAKRNYYASKADVQEQGRAIQSNILRTEAKVVY